MPSQDNERIEYIGNRLRLIVSDSHNFGTDALLLAAFAAPAKNAKVCDFGTGCGIIPFCWLRDGTNEVHAVEIQQQACAMLRKSIELNLLQDRFTLVEGDIRLLKNELPAGKFDLVTMNPPYTPAGKGIISSRREDKIARHETNLTLKELCVAAARLVKFGGRFCICLRPERLTEAMCCMREAGIEPKRLRFVSQRASKAPWLFLLEGKKGRAPGLTVEKEFYIQNPDGTQSDEILSITEKYKD